MALVRKFLTKIDNVHVNINMVHVDINNSHVNIIMLHVDIIYLACRGAKVCHHKNHCTKQNLQSDVYTSSIC